MRLPFAACTMLAVLASACSITQKVTPVTTISDRAICIIENDATRNSFLAEYERALQNRGYDTRRLPAGSSTRSCPVTTTYVARWSWDVTIYMSYAEIEVFDDGRPAGHVEYDARRGGARPDKWVDAEAKIAEFVDQLFPRQASPPR